MRIDLSSVSVLVGAVASALIAAWWVDRAGLSGDAHAASNQAAPVLVAATTADAPAAYGAPTQILKADDGHYWAEARIDGRTIRVMVDTGASVVALTPQDAARLGVRAAPSEFTATVSTASGPVRAAPVELASVAVAGARVERVEALIVEDGLPHSLLGMSYLGRLSAFTATRDSLTLRP